MTRTIPTADQLREWVAQGKSDRTIGRMLGFSDSFIGRVTMIADDRSIAAADVRIV